METNKLGRPPCVKHKNKHCKPQDISITDTGVKCRMCGEEDYTVECFNCMNCYSSALRNCPHCK